MPGAAALALVAAVALRTRRIPIELAAVWTVNAYEWPIRVAERYAEANGIAVPEGGLVLSTGIAYPVLIMIAVAAVMTWVARRRQFGRYVFAIGGNPEAAELSGINVRRTLMLTFALMGVLVASFAGTTMDTACRLQRYVIQELAGTFARAGGVSSSDRAGRSASSSRSAGC